MQEHEFDNFDCGHDFNAFDSEDEGEVDTVSCEHSVTKLRCVLSIDELEQRRAQVAFRERLAVELVNELQGKRSERCETDGFTPRRGFFQLNNNLLIQQEGDKIILQLDPPKDKKALVKHLDAIGRSLKSACPIIEAVGFSIEVMHQFYFTPCELDQFELHRFFSIVPTPARAIQKQQYWLSNGEIKLQYQDLVSDKVELKLGFPLLHQDKVQLSIKTEGLEPPELLGGFDFVVSRTFDYFDELIFDVTTPELHRLLNWD